MKHRCPKRLKIFITSVLFVSVLIIFGTNKPFGLFTLPLVTL